MRSNQAPTTSEQQLDCQATFEVSKLCCNSSRRSPRTLVRLGIALVATLLVGLLLACSSGGYPGAALASLSTTSITIDAGQQVNITATNPNSLPLTWNLGGGSCTGRSCGTLSSQTNASVTYTAPPVTSQTKATLTASVSGTQSIKTVAITVNPAPTIAGATPSGLVGTPYSATLTTAGGTGAVKLSLASGTLPAGLTFNASTGVISGTPTATGTSSFVIQGVDSSDVPYTVTASRQITITTGAIAVSISGNPPAGTVGTAYSTTLQATGGTAPYTFSVTSGALPTGLMLNAATGVISGTPSAAGSFTFTAQAKDSTGTTASASFSVTITAGNGGALTLTTGTLPNGTVNTPYNATVGVSGGTAPYTCSVASGTLPAGLSLGANCAVTGTPTAAGTSSFMVHATDSATPVNTVTGPVSITIASSALSAGGTLPSGTVNTPYTGTIPVTGGTGPYMCTIKSGNLAAGLTLNTNCTVSGKPTAPGSSTATVSVTDSGNPAQTATGTVGITVNPSGLAISSGTLPNGTVGTPYTATITGTGGTAPYTCALVNGQFPAGLTLAANCTVSGTPTVQGTSTPTVRLTDSSSPTQAATGPVSVTINASSGNLVITGPPAATVNQPYTGTIAVSGGTGPYTCTVTGGTPPAGLAVGSNCQVTGTPTTAGSAQVTVKATDSSAPTRTQTNPVTLTVNPATTTLTLTSPPTATVGTPYTGTIGVNGGAPPYICSLAGGTLPAGLGLGANCILTGTPTTPGSSTVSVTATDSTTPTNTTTAPVTITVQPVPALTFTGSLPNGVVNQPYTQTLQATGGVGPYTYAVTAGTLPAGINLASNGTLSGTPTTVGASSFTVTATDSEGTPQTASLPLVLLVTYAPTPQDALLKGPYAFLFQGYDDAVAGVLAYQTATIGSFNADGNGAVMAGESDTNHQGSNPSGNSVPTQTLIGTYTIGADNRGTLQLFTLNTDGTVGGTTTYAIALRAAVAPATNSTQGTLIRFDNDQLAGTKGAGTLLAQNPTTVAAGVVGSYAYGVSGDTPCLPACSVGLAAGPVASVGQFAFNNGGVTGSSDVTIASTNFANGTVSGTNTAPDSNGRVQLMLNNSSLNGTFYPTDYAAYVVDANRVLLMSTDKHSAFILQAGTAQLQQTNFSNASLAAPFVGYENAPVNPGLVGSTLQNVLNLSTATIFRGTGNGNGTCTTTNVDTGGTTGVVNALTGLGSNSNLVNAVLGTYQSLGNSTCTVGTNGRGTLAYPNPSTLLSGTLGLLGLGNDPPPARTVYLFNNNQGYFLETGYAGLGSLEAQISSPFTTGTLKGTFDYGTVPASSTAATITSSGTFTADGAGNTTTTLDKNVGVGTINILQLGVTTPSTYTLTDAAAGRYTLNTPAVIYAISPTRFVLLDTSALSTSPYIALLF